MANVKISQLTAKGSKIATTDRVAIAQDTGGGTFASKYVTGEELFGYKKYTATISQTGTNNPVVTVLENNLSGAIVWTRITDGNYNGALTGAFPTASKTFLLIGQKNDTITSLTYADADNVNIGTINPITMLAEDGLLTNTTIEIRIYP